MTRRAEHLARHVRELADRHGVKIEHRGNGLACRSERWVTIPEVRGQVTYLLALHELGHVLMESEPALRVDQEVAAWEWAFDNSIVEPTASNYRSILRCLYHYEQRARRRRRMRVTPRLLDFITEIEALC
jgi:hypothetical protein